MTLTILVPVYNDWPAVAVLMARLDQALSAHGRRAAVLMIDDGSLAPPDNPDRAYVPAALDPIEILHLRRNLGHQRAIAIGLAYLESRGGSDAVVVMDGDGEDRPEDVVRLLEALERDGSRRVIFAERTRRSEGALMSVLYWCYRMLHRVITGERVRVGNFSVIPAARLRTLVAVSDLWNHYAAAVFHARIPFTTIPTSRGTRYVGRSQMNFVGLVTHGLSAMSVFGDRIGVRLLIAAFAVIVAATAAAVLFVVRQTAAGVPIGAWVPYAAIAMSLLLFLMFATTLGFVFIILAGRGNAGFLPFREFSHYVSHLSSWPAARLDVEQPVHRN
jgi:hypothetical protein